MTLEEQLAQISEAGFSRMPKHIAKVLLDGIEEIASSDLKKNALNVADRVKDAELLEISGAKIKLSELFEKDFLVLNFYRGGWCPYCNMELRAYERLRSDFEKLGATIVGISSEKPDIAAVTSNKNALSFPVLSDENADFMNSMAIVFTLNENLKREYANFGIDLTRIHGNLNYQLPVPGVYVINRNFEIILKHLEENYMTRLEPGSVLSFLKEHITVGV